MTIRLAPLAAVGAVVGCASLSVVHERPDYSVQLTSVQRPQSAVARYGPQHLAVISDSGKTKFTFDDSLVRVTIFPASDGFAFRLANKTNHSIRIVWDDAAIVGPTGESGRVLHSGVKYIDRNNSQPPTVVVAKGFVTDMAVPTSNVSFSSGQYGGWDTSPFLPRPRMAPENRQSILADLQDRFRGKTVKLLLPLQIEGFTNDYLFTFSIVDVQGERSVASGIGEIAGTAPSRVEARSTDSVHKVTSGSKSIPASVQAPITRTPVRAVKPAPPTSPVGSPTRAQATIGAPASEADREAALRAFGDGNAYVGSHEWEKAEQSFQKAVLFDGSVARYHAALGSLMMLLHRWVDAQASYSAAVLLDVDNAEYRRLLKEVRARR